VAKNSYQIRDEDIEVTHVKGSGPGGQHRNKRMTGVRIKHLPTGLLVTATERRSQEQNRAAAMERMKNKLSDLYKTPKVRIKTKSSRRSVEERLTEKHKVSQKKESRRVTRGDFEK